MQGTTKKRVAIVGSGFGGAVMAARLADAGKFEVHVLERGARYGRNGFPRLPDDLRRSLFWQPDNGMFGPFEYRSFPRSRIDVLNASGLGGGSLIYSNVLYRMPEAFFEGWPGGIDRARLDPFYDRAVAMLAAKPYPIRRDGPYWPITKKAQALAEAAAKIRASPRGHPAVDLEWPPLAITFGDEPGREVINAQGVPQTACTMCGECNIGCNAHAKNTLDLNYLALAEQLGARIRTHCIVRAVRPRAGGGFDVAMADPRYSTRTEEPKVESFDIVVLAAGSLGSTELALRLGDGVATGRVGTSWSPNGDLLAFVQNTAWRQSPSAGPVITGALRVHSGRYDDGFPGGAYIEDGGFPTILGWYLLGRNAGWGPGARSLGSLVDYLWRFVRGGRANVGRDLGDLLFTERRWTEGSMMMLGMGRDRSSGTLDLLKTRHGDEVHVRWSAGDGELHYERTRRVMKLIAEALGGDLVENPLDDVLSRYVSVHPVGGLPLGDAPANGAVDAKTGQLFGADDLYVVDGSMIPTAVGPNPSLTIAALAEMYAEKLCDA